MKKNHLAGDNDKKDLEKIRAIEHDFRVEDVSVNGSAVWPFLRFYYAMASNGLTVSKPKIPFVQNLKSVIYGIQNIFRSYDYLMFSDSSERKLIEGVWFDKSVDYVGLTLKNALLFELPLPDHKPKDQIASQYVVSKYIILGLSWLYAFLFARRFKIENEEILKEIESKTKIHIPYRKLVAKQRGQEVVGAWLIRLYKPKAVFVQCSYTHFGFIKAFRERNVPVIELQHGSITKQHEAYNVFKRIPTRYYPEYLLAFGTKEQQIFSHENHFIQPEHVLPVGHYYIDYLNENYKGDGTLQETLKGYRKSVTVSAQDISEEIQLIEFLRSCAMVLKDVLFIYFPRLKPWNYYESFNFPDNLIMTPWLNIYQSMAQTNFHSTIFSSCATEAPALGCKNILININNLAAENNRELLMLPGTSRIANTPNEYIEIIAEEIPNRRELIQLTEAFIKPGYKTNIAQALQQIMQYKSIVI